MDILNSTCLDITTKYPLVRGKYSSLLRITKKNFILKIYTVTIHLYLLCTRHCVEHSYRWDPSGLTAGGVGQKLYNFVNKMLQGA